MTRVTEKLNTLLKIKNVIVIQPSRKEVRKLTELQTLKHVIIRVGQCCQKFKYAYSPNLTWKQQRRLVRQQNKVSLLLTHLVNRINCIVN